MGITEYILGVALCAASISYTISCTSIFNWLRELIAPIHKKLEELIFCPYCLSHYIIMAIMLIALLNNSGQYIKVTDIFFVDFMITWFAIVCVVSLLHYVMIKAYIPIAEAMNHRMLAKKSKQRQLAKAKEQ